MGLDLKKKTELVGLRLKKFDVADNTVCRVVMVNDGSGSMADLYRDGTMAELNDRCFAVANRFDDNQSLEQYVFSSDWVKLEDATPDTFGTYCQEVLVPALNFGGTIYSGVANEILRSLTHVDVIDTVTIKGKEPGFLGKLFGKKAEPDIPHSTAKQIVIDPKDPMFVIFQTDGDNDSRDERAFLDVITKSQGQKIFWMFLGVGQSSFHLLRTVGGRYENCDFIQATDISRMTDEQLYDALLSEKFCKWLNETVKK